MNQTFVFKISKIITIQELLDMAIDLTKDSNPFIEIHETCDDYLDGKDQLTVRARGMILIDLTKDTSQ
jgi:hypothetical protein